MTDTKSTRKKSEVIQAEEAVAERKGKSSKPVRSKKEKDKARRGSDGQEKAGKEEASTPTKQQVEATQPESIESGAGKRSTKRTSESTDPPGEEAPSNRDRKRDKGEVAEKKSKSKREKRRSSRNVESGETGRKGGGEGERESTLKPDSIPTEKEEKEKPANKHNATTNGSEVPLTAHRTPNIHKEDKAKEGERREQEGGIRAGGDSKSKLKRRTSKKESDRVGTSETAVDKDVGSKGKEERKGREKSGNEATSEGDHKRGKKGRRHSKRGSEAGQGSAVDEASTPAKANETPTAENPVENASDGNRQPKRRRSKDRKKSEKDQRRESTDGKKERRRSSGLKKLMDPAETAGVDPTLPSGSEVKDENRQDVTETGTPTPDTAEAEVVGDETAKVVADAENNWANNSDKENVKEEVTVAAVASTDPQGGGASSTTSGTKENPFTLTSTASKDLLPPVTSAVTADPVSASPPARTTVSDTKKPAPAEDAKIDHPTPESAARLAESAKTTRNDLRGGSDGRSEEPAKERTAGDGGEQQVNATITPTPPRRRSNPIERGTPPNRGSRAGNLTISTQHQQQGWSPTGRGGGGEGEGGDYFRPTSPRSRPRDKPLVSAKGGLRDGQDGNAEGFQGNDGCDVGAETGSTQNGGKETARAFSSRRWKASDEYVLDEERETPRGGVFAKIPGLEQHMAVETKRMHDPPRCRPPKLISGTVRMYDQEDASEAAFRYPECRGAVFRPSYADDGSFDNLPAGSPFLSEPPHKLRLEKARGYHGGGFYPSTDNNAYFLGESRMPKGGRGYGGSGNGDKGENGGVSGSAIEKENSPTTEASTPHRFEVVYPTAALVVMQEFRVRDRDDQSEGRQVGPEVDDSTRIPGRQGRGGLSAAGWWGQGRPGEDGGSGGGEGKQRFYDGHTDDVTAVAVHPGGILVASGQVGRNPIVLVWTSSAECAKGGAVLNKQKATIATLKGHERKICCLDFSPDGWLLCSVGADCKSTTNVWDWRKGVTIAKVQAGTGPIHAFRFNPYQCYGVPSKKPVPGQALHIDDACYCLVSIGARHSKFWLLTRGVEEPSRDEIPPVLANAKWTTSQRVHEERDKGIKGRGNLTWILDGSAARLNGKGKTADFTCMAFIDDSPLLQTWGTTDAVIDSPDKESDRTSGRVVLGTAAGDLYVFIQRGVRLIPREFANAVKQGKGGRGIFLDPWWLFGPGHEVTANKRLWDLGAELVENIPHSLEAANELMLSDKAKERVRALEQKMAVKPLHTAVFEELQRQHDRLSYTGPLTGHGGGVSALAFNRETGKVVSAGTNGEIVQWQAFFFDPSHFLAPARRASASSAREGAVADCNASTGPPASASAHGSKRAMTAAAVASNNSSLVGLINARRDRQEEKLQKSLRSRDPSEPRLLRVGHEAPRGDGRMGGVDAFELDYQTTLGREDGGEVFLSDFDGSAGRSTNRDSTEPSRVDMFGSCGKVDGLEFSGIGGGNERAGAAAGGSRRGSRDERKLEGSDGVEFRLHAQMTEEVGVEFHLSREKGEERPGTSPFGAVKRDSAGAGEPRAEGVLLEGGGGQGVVSSGPSTPALLPRGSHCKSLVWSLDGKRLLAGVNTNVLLLLQYPPDDGEPSSDKRVVTVSPRRRGEPQQPGHARNCCRFSSDGDDRSRRCSVMQLIQGHSGSVMALAVFEGLSEYVTAGYDRSVAIWNAASNLPVAWCHHLPSPVSCVACSPDLDEVAIGTVNTNEILFLKVRRQGRVDPCLESCAQQLADGDVKDASSRMRQAGDDSPFAGEDTSSRVRNGNAAIGIELHHSKQLLPASAWAKRRPPGPNSRWITTAPSWDRCQIVTLDGKDTPHVGAGGSAAHHGGGGGGGHAAPPHKPQTVSTKASPVRSRATSASQCTQSLSPGKSPSRPPTFGTVAGFGDGGGAGFVGDDHTRRGRRRGSNVGGEPSRGMGASCMRFSPSGSHLAVGCKNGSLVIMAVETENKGGDGTGERSTAGHNSYGDPSLAGQVGKHSRSEARREESSASDRVGQRNEIGDDETRVGGRYQEEDGSCVGAESSAYVGRGGDDGSGGGSPSLPSHRRQRQSKKQRRKVYRRIAHLKGHSSRVLHLDWTEDGRFVHTCGQDYHILHWEILPALPDRQERGAAEEEREARNNDDGESGDDNDDAEGATGEFRPRMFKRAFLVRDQRWATWSSTIGWPVQGVFPLYSDNSDVNAVDLCANRNLLATADDAKTVRLLRYPVLKGGARNRSYTGHSSHVMSARFTIGTNPTRLITLGGMDSTVLQWVVEDASPR